MRAAIHTPYLETLGGGERYVLSVAKVLLDHGWSVDLETTDKEIVGKVENKFGFSLAGINTAADIRRGNGYDLCFWLSDGSVPTLSARKNILHFQRPFFKVDGKSLINRMKFIRINKVVVNSKFTKTFIDKEYPVESVVLYPPVDVKKFRGGQKENLILYVGRFSQLEQNKRQDVLLRAFKKLHDRGNQNWKLVLAGGSEVGRTKFVDKLHEDAKTYPVSILENPGFAKLRDLYGSAKIFWCASGYGIDADKEPNKVEHFGITIVEAMAAGLVPVVFAAGGPKEIVAEGENGYLWRTTEQLIDKTMKLVADERSIRRLSLRARKDAQKYSYDRFEKEFLALL